MLTGGEREGPGTQGCLQVGPARCPLSEQSLRGPAFPMQVWSPPPAQLLPHLVRHRDASWRGRAPWVGASPRDPPHGGVFPNRFTIPPSGRSGLDLQTRPLEVGGRGADP